MDSRSGWLAGGWVGAVLAIAVAVAPGQAWGAEGDRLWGWYNEGMAIAAEEEVTERYFAHASDGAGGAVVAWQADVPGPVLAQRVDSGGNLAWASPVQVSAGASAKVGEVVYVGGGETIVFWLESGRVYARKLSSAGVKMWAGPVALTSAAKSIVSVMAAPSSQGAFVVAEDTTNVYGMHVGRDGAVWSPGVNGHVLGPRGYEGELTSYGAGGDRAYVAWTEGGEVLVQQLELGYGWLSLPWGGTPKLAESLSNFMTDATADMDASGNVLVAWRSLETGGTAFRVQKMGADGSLHWGQGGVALVSSAEVGGYGWSLGLYNLEVVTDDDGGAYVAWNDWRNSTADPQGQGNDDIYAQHVDAGGARLWKANGMLVPNWPGGSERGISMVRDTVGGAVLAYEEKDASWDITVVRLGPGGKIWEGRAHADSSPWEPQEDQRSPVVIYDASGPEPTGAVVVYRHGWVEDIYGQKMAMTTLNTPAGQGVEVTQGGVTVKLNTVLEAGYTAIATNQSGTPLDMISYGHACDPPQYFRVTTSADYWGPVDIEIHYNESRCGEALLRLLYHCVGWIPVDTGLDTGANVIRGRSTGLGEYCLVSPRYLEEFSRMTEADIEAMASTLTTEAIDGSDGLEFWPETWFVYKTTMGRYGKMVVEELDKDLDHRLRLAWETYDSDGAVHSYGSGLYIHAGNTAEMDEGSEGGTKGAEWRWSIQDETQRCLSPVNRSKFRLMRRVNPPSFLAINEPYLRGVAGQMGADWIVEPIEGGFCFNTYWAYRTSQGRLGKAAVVAFHNTPELFYTLALAWATYNADGTLYNAGLNQLLPNNCGFDADSGVLKLYPPDGNTDWWWWVDEPSGLAAIMPWGTGQAVILNISHSMGPGDCTCDNEVNLLDLGALGGSYGDGGCSLPEWCVGRDQNRDGVVDLADVWETARNWLAGH